MNVQLCDENLTRLTACVEDGTYPSLDAAVNALVRQSLDSVLPKTVKYDNDRLAMGLGGKDQLDSVFALIVEQAAKCVDLTPFPVSRIIERLPKSVQESLTPNMRRILGGMFHRHAAKVDKFRRIGYSSPAVYICTDTFSYAKKT